MDSAPTRTMRFVSVEEYLRKSHAEYDFIFSIKQSAQGHWHYTPKDAERTQIQMIEKRTRGSQASGSAEGIGNRRLRGLNSDDPIAELLRTTMDRHYYDMKIQRSCRPKGGLQPSDAANAACSSFRWKGRASSVNVPRHRTR